MSCMSVLTRRIDYWESRRRWVWGFAAFWFVLGVLSLIFMTGARELAWTAGAWLLSLVWGAIGAAVERRVRSSRRASA